MATDSTAGRLSPGEILDVRLLGEQPARGEAKFGTAVYYVRYATRAGTLAAKLFLPLGRPPRDGWPTSIWLHGLGDPASDYFHWPFVGENWRATRGALAGRWAAEGIVTLTPWMPGAGPSEPLGGYSPLSLDLHVLALADSFTALRNLEVRLNEEGHPARATYAVPRFDHARLVLRADCVATSLLMYFARDWQSEPAAAGLRALVVDDFTPSVAYNEYFLGPYLCRLPPLRAAALRCMWARVVWALARDRGWSLDKLFNPAAIALFDATVATPAGPMSRIVGSRLMPLEHNELAALVARAATGAAQRTVNGQAIRDWMYAPALVDWASQPTLERIVAHPAYREFFAASDPFFTENIAPFAPGLRLFVVGRGGDASVHAEGLPSFDERCKQMVLPKVRTLQSWGWKVDVYHGGPRDGTSFSGGTAQRWTLDHVLAESQS